MPIYEYHCEACGTRFDKLVRSLSSQFIVQCPECGSRDCKKAVSLFGSSSSSGSVGGASCAPSG